MKYNPQIHHRRSIRLKGYDYSKAGAYFITICCQQMKCRFGEIVDGQMILNEYGQIAYNEWGKLAERFINFELDVFQIMPNHMHGIIVLNDELVRIEENGIADSDSNSDEAGARVNRARTVHSIGNIVGAYKSLVSNGCLEIYKVKNEMMGKLWHRNFYENIIRDEQAYINISNYILNNPAKWKDDKFFSK